MTKAQLFTALATILFLKMILCVRVYIEFEMSYFFGTLSVCLITFGLICVDAKNTFDNDKFNL